MPKKKRPEGENTLVVKGLEDGAKVEDLCRKLEVSETTVYNWRKKYAGMSTPEVRRLKQIEEVNTRLQRFVADLTLDKVIYSAGRHFKKALNSSRKRALA